MKITKSQLKEIIRDELSNLKERNETGLYVTPSTDRDKQKIENWLKTSQYHAEWNRRDGYFIFPEKPNAYDRLERELDKIFTKLGVDVQFEGI